MNDHEITTADTPQRNGIAGRMNRTLVERVRTMLTDADLPESYWWDTLQYATLLHNISPTRALDDSTPEEAWSGNKPDVSRLRTFGCRALVHIPDKLRGKPAAKSLVCMFVGYACQQKAYRLVHHPTGRFLDSHDVVFDEGGPVTVYERIILEPAAFAKSKLKFFYILHKWEGRYGLQAGAESSLCEKCDPHAEEIWHRSLIRPPATEC